MSVSGLLLLSLNTLMLVVGVSIIARYLRIPYTVSLVIAGLLITLLFPASLPHFSPEVFLTFLLPPIIFQAGTKIDVSDVRRDLKIILTYAFVGTLLSSILVGLLSYHTLGFARANSRSAKWIASDAYRELTSEYVQKRLHAREEMKTQF